MLRAFILSVGFAAVAAILPHHAIAQTDPAPAAARDTLYEIHLRDGSVLIASEVEDAGASLVVVTRDGVRVSLRREQVASIERVEGRMVDGRMWADDPNGTRLFFGPTARSVPAGEGYFGVFELFFPFVSYGVTDRFTLSAGTPIAPEIIGEVFYLAPKLEVVRTPTVRAAVGALALFATDDALDGSVGLLYGVGTFGTADDALTVGATVPFIASNDESDIGSEPVFMLGGETRISRRTKLISENYLVRDEGAILSGGLRFFGERLSADFGLATAVAGSDGGWCCAPLLNFVYTF